MTTVAQYTRHIRNEMMERANDPDGFAAREEARRLGAGQTLTITHYAGDVSLSHRTFNGRDFGFDTHTNDGAETFALEALERQPQLTIIEVDKR